MRGLREKNSAEEQDTPKGRIREEGDIMEPKCPKDKTAEEGKCVTAGSHRPGVPFCGGPPRTGAGDKTHQTERA